MKRFLPILAALSLSAPVLGAETGQFSFVWHKTERAALAEHCIGAGVASCSIRQAGVCHIYAPDTVATLRYVGREFFNCQDGITTAHAARAGEVITIQYKLLSDAGAHAECGQLLRSHTALACYIYAPKLMITPSDRNNMRNLNSIGHELKHAVDGDWHNRAGELRANAFTH